MGDLMQYQISITVQSAADLYFTLHTLMGDVSLVGTSVTDTIEIRPV
jgi:hypothetical protein